MYLVSALGGLFGADGGEDAFVPSGHRNALCSSQPTSDIMLALRKYGVTSLRNLTGKEQTRFYYFRGIAETVYR
jgi:hypothetical protein